MLYSNKGGVNKLFTLLASISRPALSSIGAFPLLLVAKTKNCQSVTANHPLLICFSLQTSC